MGSQGQTQLSVCTCTCVHAHTHTHTHTHTRSDRYELPESDLRVFSYETEKISEKKNLICGILRLHNLLSSCNFGSFPLSFPLLPSSLISEQFSSKAVRWNRVRQAFVPVWGRCSGQDRGTRTPVD